MSTIVLSPRDSTGLPAELARLVRYRDLLLLLVQKDLKAKYKGTALGFLWSFLAPPLSRFPALRHAAMERVHYRHLHCEPDDRRERKPDPACQLSARVPAARLGAVQPCEHAPQPRNPSLLRIRIPPAAGTAAAHPAPVGRPPAGTDCGHLSAFFRAAGLFPRSREHHHSAPHRALLRHSDHLPAQRGRTREPAPTPAVQSDPVADRQLPGHLVLEQLARPDSDPRIRGCLDGGPGARMVRLSPFRARLRGGSLGGRAGHRG